MRWNSAGCAPGSLRPAALGLAVLLFECTVTLAQTPPPQLTLAAAPAGDSTEDWTITEELKALEDPTTFARRVWLDTERNKFKDGSHEVLETLGAVWAWRLSTNEEWAVRFKMPYSWHLAGHTAGDSDEQGLGDLKLATGPGFRLGKSWRTAGGLELRMPTATGDQGENVWRLQEFWALAWDATPWLTFSPSAEYNQSLAELHGASPSHYLETYFPATFLLPHRWSLTARYETKVNFERDNYVTPSVKLLVAKQLNHPPLGFALSIKKPFDGGEKQFQVNFFITYYFR